MSTGREVLWQDAAGHAGVQQRPEPVQPARAGDDDVGLQLVGRVDDARPHRSRRRVHAGGGIQACGTCDLGALFRHPFRLGDRVVVGCALTHLKQWRGIATRYELNGNYRAAVMLHTVITWARSFRDTL